MNFNSPKPIFLQIYDMIIDELLTGKLTNGSRIISVRDMGEKIAVNPNTVQRAYSELQNNCIIEQRRGIGYFVCSNGVEISEQIRRKEFLSVQLPLLVKQAKELNISWEELTAIANIHKVD